MATIKLTRWIQISPSIQIEFWQQLNLFRDTITYEKENFYRSFEKQQSKQEKNVKKCNHMSPPPPPLSHQWCFTNKKDTNFSWTIEMQRGDTCLVSNHKNFFSKPTCQTFLHACSHTFSLIVTSLKLLKALNPYLAFSPFS